MRASSFLACSTTGVEGGAVGGPERLLGVGDKRVEAPPPGAGCTRTLAPVYWMMREFAVERNARERRRSRVMFTRFSQRSVPS
jgi:hypothetical protein